MSIFTAAMTPFLAMMTGFTMFVVVATASAFVMVFPPFSFLVSFSI